MTVWKAFEDELRVSVFGYDLSWSLTLKLHLKKLGRDE